MRRAVRWLRGLLLILVPGALGAADPGLPPIRAYNQDSGLPQNTILHLARDTQGRLWVGTQDGAARYDGSRWQVYNMPNATRSNIVDVVLPASDGAIWFGRRDEGVARLQGGVWTTYGPGEGLPRGRVTSLLETTEPGGGKVLWAAVLGLGLARFDGRAWVPAEANGELPNRRPWKLVAAGEGAFWIATEGGLFQWQGGHIHAVPGVPRVNTNCLLPSTVPGGAQGFWMGTYGDGLYRVEDSRVTHFGSAEGLPSQFVTDLAEAPDGQGGTVLWVATLAGLARYHHGTWTTFGPREGIPGGTVYRVLPDVHPGGLQEVWVGTAGGGVVRLSLGRWTSHDTRTGLPDERVWCTLETQAPPLAGTLWVGTTRGLLRQQGEAWVLEAPAERIVALLETRSPGGRSVVWAGGVKGLWSLEEGRWRSWGARDGFPAARVNALLETRDEDGGTSLWVGTELKGILRLKAGRWTQVPPQPGVLGDYVSTLLHTRDPQTGDTLWIGTRDGLARLDREGLRAVHPAGGLPNNTVNALLPYPSSGEPTHLLIGTFGGGLHRLDLAHPEAALQPFPPGGEPLPSGVIQDLLWDPQGNLFIFTVKGVVRLSPGGGRSWSSLTFTREDGLASDQVSVKGAAAGVGGRIWVGSSSGVASLDPAQVRTDHEAKTLVVEEVVADGQSLEPTGPLSLPPRTRRVVVHFALLSLFRETETRFRTQLLGVESDPSPWDRLLFRELANLAPGAYTLRVWGRDYAGNISGPLDVPFEIRPALWQTWWFRLLLMLAAGGTIWVVVAWRSRTAEAHHRELEALVVARTEELAQANQGLVQEVKVRQAAERTKDEFVAVVSHELRTPLTSIHGALGLMRSGALGALPPEAGKLVDLAHRNSLRLQALVNDLLDIQKIEAGVLTLAPAPVALGQLVNRAMDGLAGYAETCGVHIRWAEPPDRAAVEGDEARLEQVMANLLSNACKHSPDGAEVRVLLRRGEGWVRVSVENHGAPIPAAFRPHLFQKFAMADASSTRRVGGTGLGLAICKAIIEKHGGRVGYESDAQATTFWFELPLANG